jgi:hypothetical protein
MATFDEWLYCNVNTALLEHIQVLTTPKGNAHARW